MKDMQAPCPVMICRPGIPGTRETVWVLHGTSVGHLSEAGYAFPRLWIKMLPNGEQIVLKDNGAGTKLPPSPMTGNLLSVWAR